MSETRKLLDLWLPPEGAGRAMACLATTFTFDADFFEQQCAGRFLGLDARPGEAASDLGYIIEREEKLAETPVCVVADRGLNPDARSLRWDILTVRAPTGVMHAKLSLLVWDRAVRFIVSSANLSEPAYRSSIELATVFDAHEGTELPRAPFDDLLEALERILNMAPAGIDGEGPQPRALGIVERARDRLQAFELPSRAGRHAPRLSVVMPSPGRDALDGLLETWSGGPPHWAKVMSPYFDSAQAPSRAAGRLVEILSKRRASIDIIVPVDHLGDQEIVRVPAALMGALPRRIERRLLDVKQPEPDEPRGLHGKLVLLESEHWVSALIGSSNFTAAGLGLDGGGNVEIGIALGAPQGSPTAEGLRRLALPGDPLPPGAQFVATEDPEDRPTPIPIGFVQALGDPPALLHLELEPASLPAEWSANTPDGAPLIDAQEWARRGCPEIIDLPVPGEYLPFNVVVRWRAGEGHMMVASLPVNVLDLARLPPHEELRGLPVDALLRALASTRPLHEGLTDAWERLQAGAHRPADELDPLKRFSPAGQLLHRTRELSLALAGLKERLERPAATFDAFRWRLEGPFGPLQIAKGLIEERQQGTSVQGEASFMLAEIALTLAEVDVVKTTRFIPERLADARAEVDAVIADLAALRGGFKDAPQLRGYVDEAFARAGR